MGFADELAARAARKQQSPQKRNHIPQNDNGNVGTITTSPGPEKPNRCGEGNDRVHVGPSTSSSFAEQLERRNASIRRRDDHFDSHEDPRSNNNGFYNLTSREKSLDSDHAKYVNSSIAFGDRPHDAEKKIMQSSPSILNTSDRSPSSPKADTNDNSTCISSQSKRKDAASSKEEEEGDGTTQSVRLGQTHHVCPGNDREALTNDIPENHIFGAWAQIEQLKRRVRDAEESALQERRRADNATFELRLVKQGRRHRQLQRGNGSWTVSSVGGDSTEVTTAIQSPESDCNSIKTTYEGHESESDECIEETSGRLPHSSLSAVSKDPNCCDPIAISSAASTAISSTTTTHFATPPHREDTDMIIRLKNAEINVLRSQVRRLEMRIQEVHDRNIDEDLTLTESFHYGRPKHVHYGDALPLEVAMERMLAHPEYVTSRANATPIEELRLLRNDVQTLKRQLRLKGGIVNDAAGGEDSNGGSASSLREGRDSNLYAENAVDGETEEEEGGIPSSWGLCCFRGRRRSGYGRV